MAKRTYEELENEITAVKKVIIPGSKWRHYKGGEYTITDIIVQEEDNALAVVYQPFEHPTVRFTRPVSVWGETVVWKGQTVQRFSEL